jgi:hypothetical protein
MFLSGEVMFTRATAVGATIASILESPKLSGIKDTKVLSTLGISHDFDLCERHSIFTTQTAICPEGQHFHA